MKIAFDVSYIQRRRSGIGRYSLSLLTDLLQADSQHEFILHGWSWSLDDAALRALQSPHAHLRIAHIPGNIKRFYWERLRRPNIGRFLGSFDLFHSLDPSFPPTGSCPVVVTVHDLISRSHPQFFTPGIVARDSRIARSLENASAVIVPSQYARTELASTGRIDPERIVVASPSIPPVFTPDAVAGDPEILGSLGIHRPYMLNTGTIEPRKNIAGLITAFELLCDSGISVDLVLAGKMGWMSEDIPARIRTSRHTACIRHLDYVSDPVLAALYRNAIFFVYPSFLEGYGLPVAEAMASGVPVVTSDSTGMAEIAGHGAILIAPTDLRQLREEMEKLLTSGAYRESARARALKRGDELRRSEAAQSLLRLYEGLGKR